MTTSAPVSSDLNEAD